MGRLKRPGESEGENGGRGGVGGRKRKGENELAFRPNGNKSKWWDANCLGVFKKRKGKKRSALKPLFWKTKMPLC